MSTQKFVVSHMDQQMGPFDEQELKSKWAKGEILAIDYVYDENQEDWILLAELFAWAKAEEVSPPPPVRTDTAVIRRMTASIVNPAAAPKSSVSEVTALRTESDIHPPAAETTQPKAEELLKEKDLEITLNTPAKTVEPAIKYETIVPAPAARPTPNPAGAKVKLVDGEGEIDLSGLNPGRVELVLQDTSASLKMLEPLRIQVKPAEPVEVTWTIANQQVVGRDVEVSIRALDEHGNVCLRYTDQFVIQIRGENARDISLSTQDGQATIKLSNTKAETWNVALLYSGVKKLKLPEARTLEWSAGPAARLVLDGPHEYIAGVPLKVQVKAVDSFGNVAKNFQGTVVLEVKAS